MAGAVTHLLIAERAAADLDNEPGSLGAVIADPHARPFLFMGAVSPDIPYLGGFFLRDRHWADWMHYEDTNKAPCSAVLVPGVEDFPELASGRAYLAWAAGYVTHCVTDATVHPIVQAVVGPYQSHPVRHRECEMFQDSLLFQEVKGRELPNSQFVDILKRCEDEESALTVADNWSACLGWAYGVRKRPRTTEWLDWYVRAVNAAADADLLALLSRPFKGMRTIVYQPTEELRRQPKLCRDYYEAARRPGSETATCSFADEVFPKAVQNVLEAWVALWEDVTHATSLGNDMDHGNLRKVVRNWDLDTGIDMDQPDAGVTYWPRG